MVRHRHALEQWEAGHLAPWATPSREASRFHHSAPEPPESDFRTSFQRDRDRILHSRAFRRLKHKTQVYVPHTGDHPRTRLTHTLEVAQIGRTVGRALGLNEDLVEAIALGHDLGHTPFGHTGEHVLRSILDGAEPTCPLPADVVREVGTFRHNYQSLRVVDRLESRYHHPGLNLSDQVREGILKHTTWQRVFPFPLTATEGLRLSRPCHLEGQVVALADEIAQQTHDLEDGLSTEAVSLAEIESLEAVAAVIAVSQGTYEAQPSAQRRAAILHSGLIRLFVADAVHTSDRRVRRSLDRHGIRDRAGWLRIADTISATTVRLSAPAGAMLAQLKAFIYRSIINHIENNRRDHRAHLVMCGLFRAYHHNPLLLPNDALQRFRDVAGVPFLRDVPIPQIPAQVVRHYHPDPRFARLITDHLAGMSDRYALEEYETLYHPGGVLHPRDTGRW